MDDHRISEWEGLLMKVFNFTLAFSVMAADEVDARLKLKELLMSISKQEILWAMKIEEDEDA